MNRRKFLKGVAAVGISITSGALIAREAVKTSSFTHDGTDMTMVYVNCVRLPEPRILFVTAKASEAREIYRQMGRPKNVMVTGCGGQLCGMGADMIIVDDQFDSAEATRERAKDWFNQSVRTRLVPDGEMVDMSLSVAPFNWGEMSTVTATFEGKGELLRQGIMHRKPLKQLTPSDYVMSKAKFLEWFIEHRRTRP